MILSRHWVFVHMPKTGGSFVRHLMRRHAPPDWATEEMHEHVRARDVPAAHGGLPKFGFARNPLSWYVSWFHHKREEPDKLFREISSDGTLGFRESLRRLFDHRLTQGVVPGGFAGGPMSQMLQDFFGPGLSHVEVFAMENLRQELLEYFQRFGEVPEALRGAISEQRPVNVRGNGEWGSHYDPELEAMVRDRDRLVFEHFGYD